ncbi:MAG: hypothetical protein WCO84_01470 [bacterium]
MFSRLTNVKLGKLVDDETGESLSDVESALNKVGVAIRVNKTTFKDMEVVIGEVANKWTTYNDVERAAIANAIAGVRQKENFLVLMNNYNKVLEYNTTQTNSAGLATERYALYMESIEGRLNTLKATWESVWMKTINSDAIKLVVSALSFLLEKIDELGGLVPVLAGILAGVLYASLGTITTAIIALNAQLSLTNILTAGMPLLIGIIVTILSGAIITTNTATQAMKMHNGQLIDTAKSYKKLKGEIDDFNTSMEDKRTTTAENVALGEAYLRQLEELSVKENLSASEKQRMQAAVEGLNSAIPNLNVGINGTTGKLNTQISSIKALITNYKMLIALEIAEAKTKFLTQKTIELDMSADKTFKDIAITKDSLKKQGNLPDYLSPYGAKLKSQRAELSKIFIEQAGVQKDLDEAFFTAKTLADKIFAVPTGATTTDDPNANKFGDPSGGANGVDAYKADFDERYKLLKHALAMNEITEKQYYVALEVIYKAFFKDKAKYTDEYMQYEEEVYAGRIALAKEETERLKAEFEKRVADAKEAITKETDNYNNASSYMVNKITEEITAKQALKKASDEFYDGEIAKIQAKNDEISTSIALQEKEEALARAKSNKVRLYREGQGFVYESDISAIATAQQELSTFKKEQETKAEIQRLEDAKTAKGKIYDDEITILEGYKTTWQTLVSDYKTQQDKLLAEQLLGITSEGDNWKTRLAGALTFKDKYNAIMADLNTQANATQDVAGKQYATGGSGKEFGYNPTNGNITVKRVGETGYSIVKPSDANYANTAKAVVSDTKGAIKIGGYANGTLGNSSNELAMTGEMGRELKILPRGTGVIPNPITENLMKLGQFSPQQLFNRMSQASVANFAGAGGGGINISIGNLSLPSVKDGNSFVSDIQSYAKNMAIKMSGKR